mmetsp:Transcript_4085/g.17337  ORF Transcript_4085/g.17337 Transcript_4085/m.17337 type:complete len:248 (-) Transcript_4085:1323-2066(-)
MSSRPPRLATAPPRPAETPVRCPSTTQSFMRSSPPATTAAAPPVSDQPPRSTRFSSDRRPHLRARVRNSPSASGFCGPRGFGVRALSFPQGENDPVAVSTKECVSSTHAPELSSYHRLARRDADDATEAAFGTAPPCAGSNRAGLGAGQRQSSWSASPTVNSDEVSSPSITHRFASGTTYVPVAASTFPGTSIPGPPSGPTACASPPNAYVVPAAKYSIGRRASKRVPRSNDPYRVSECSYASSSQA